MSERVPQIIVLGGPNGAGKTTAAPGVLRDLLKLGEFVNADTIAAGLAGFAPERSSFAAGRIMLRRLHELAAARADFAFETTMASRTFAPWWRDLRADGYQVNMLFMWLRSPELAVRRVMWRVRKGGHDVPADIVRRRYLRGIHNFMHMYSLIAMSWRGYDNSATSTPQLIAQGGEGVQTIIQKSAVWRRILKEADDGAQDQEHV